jgi:hypothetical protein
MGDSVEYRDGVFVATGPHTAVGGESTGTALMVRPDEHLAPVGTPGPLVSAEVPPAGPVGPVRSTAPSPGGARRIAVATVIATVIAAVAFGAAAFGGAFGGSGTPSPGSARGALGAAAANSSAAPSVAFTLSATRSTSSSTTTLVTGSGAVDLRTATGSLTATVPSLARLVGSGDDTVNVISDGTSIYLGSPALSSLTGGPTWLKAGLPQGATSSSADSSTLAVLSNPSQLLGLLSSIGGQVTTVGHVDLNGVPTTEYRTTVTVSELASRAGLTAGSAVGGRIAQILGQLGNTSVPVTAWVGDDGYVRQLQVSVNLSRATLGGLASDLITGSLGGSSADQATSATSVTVGFSHYGAPVSVTVPPANQTTDVGAIVSSIQGVMSQIGHDFSGLASRI